MSDTIVGIRPYEPEPLNPSPDTAVCKNCGLDRDATVAAAWEIAAIPFHWRTDAQHVRVRELIALLDGCEQGCGANGGWRVTP